MEIRKMTEVREQQMLSEYAALSKNTRGRRLETEKCDIRTDYQRDRDRIIHSKAFRRLKHKTQVFISPEGDHYRTRLTHTLEVSQIARTIARALRLNEDLTEAIALGHDLGHTPFGHAGEEVLNKIHPLGFRHNEQSLRVVDLLEGGKGLNLTYEVRDGILNHSGDGVPETMEGKIVKFSDRIAYINHDIDDALRAGVIDIESIPAECLALLGTSHKKRINTMIVDIIKESTDINDIRMSKDIKYATDKLRSFMFENVYIGSKAKLEEKKAQNIVRELYYYFLENPDQIPHYNSIIKNQEEIERLACDYIAGMTDRYALSTFLNVFVPLAWEV
ncbi:MAG: deoxyguanosinetriphosphate triphosphohydrolase [Clostridiales bacterium GWB2_37_7]|nr:MAG: deoxyguanosinetriphosphate triphosphohydrolase [Clostridiales bacterium GWB2_37_7]